MQRNERTTRRKDTMARDSRKKHLEQSIPLRAKSINDPREAKNIIPSLNRSDRVVVTRIGTYEAVSQSLSLVPAA